MIIFVDHQIIETIKKAIRNFSLIYIQGKRFNDTQNQLIWINTNQDKVVCRQIRKLSVK